MAAQGVSHFELARRLEGVFGARAAFWIALEGDYAETSDPLLNHTSGRRIAAAGRRAPQEFDQHLQVVIAQVLYTEPCADHRAGRGSWDGMREGKVS